MGARVKNHYKTSHIGDRTPFSRLVSELFRQFIRRIEVRSRSWLRMPLPINSVQASTYWIHKTLVAMKAATLARLEQQCVARPTCRLELGIHVTVTSGTSNAMSIVTEFWCQSSVEERMSHKVSISIFSGTGSRERE